MFVSSFATSGELACDAAELLGTEKRNITSLLTEPSYRLEVLYITSAWRVAAKCLPA